MSEDSNPRPGETPVTAGATSRSIPVVDAAALRRSAGVASVVGAVRSEAGSAPDAPGRDPLAKGTWYRSILVALGVLYVPALAPLFLGPLQECDHCVETYYQYFPLVPGATGFSAFGLGDARIALSIALAATTFGLVLWSLRRGGRIVRWIVCVAAMAWVFSQAMWFSLLLRM